MKTVDKKHLLDLIATQGRLDDLDTHMGEIMQEYTNNLNPSQVNVKELTDELLTRVLIYTIALKVLADS